MIRLFVDITAHGYGHLSQTAPVLAALQTLCPIQLIIRSGLPELVLRSRIETDFIYVHSQTGFGLAMKSPFEVDPVLTLARYGQVQKSLKQHLAPIEHALKRYSCDAVLSNIDYIPLIAAAGFGIPAIAFSSLNWADVVWRYCAALPLAREVAEPMAKAYQSATAMIRLLPGMPMPHFNAFDIVRPIARVGQNRRTDLIEMLDVPERSTVVLLAFGGMLPKKPPPFVANGTFVTIGPGAWSPYGCAPADQIPMPFEDIIASVDLVISKAGYGITAELGCIGTPSILVSRHGWPEEEYFMAWLKSRGRCSHCTSMDELVSERVELELRRMVAMATSNLAEPGGEQDVAHRILSLLS